MQLLAYGIGCREVLDLPTLYARSEEPLGFASIRSSWL
jgi:hypothetical protein